MKLLRLLALCAALPLLTQASASIAAPLPLGDDELSQLHAGGLPDAALQGVALGALAPSDLAAAHELAGSADRQQALAQTRFASSTAQASAAMLRTATLPTLFTPLAPLFLPALAMPFPFLMAPPPKKH